MLLLFVFMCGCGGFGARFCGAKGLAVGVRGVRGSRIVRRMELWETASARDEDSGFIIGTL